MKIAYNKIKNSSFAKKTTAFRYFPALFTTLFMQNEPNLKTATNTLTAYPKSLYANKTEYKPKKTNPIRTQSNPIYAVRSFTKTDNLQSWNLPASKAANPINAPYMSTLPLIFCQTLSSCVLYLELSQHIRNEISYRDNIHD
jgi:hypothetical protein